MTQVVEAGGSLSDGYVGMMVNKTSISGNPAVTGFTTVAVPTAAVQQIDGHLSWGFEFEGTTASIMDFLHVGYDTSDRYVQPMLGVNVGYAVRISSGYLSANFILDGVAVQLGSDSTTQWIDIGAQLRFTHPIGERIRASAILQGAQTRSSNEQDVQLSARLEGMFQFARHISAFASVAFDARGRKDSSLPDAKFRIDTTMFRFGLSFHTVRGGG